MDTKSQSTLPMAFSSSTAASWSALPNEMMLAVIDLLDGGDVVSLSKADHRTYQACVPARFTKVGLLNFETLQLFVENVPRSYYAYIQDLFLCTKSNNASFYRVLPSIVSDLVNAVLMATKRLVKLDLHIEGSLDKSVLFSFQSLTTLKSLSIANCADEITAPLSERFAVYAAASARYLEELSLDRVTRSKLHAPELEGVYPCPPLILNDTDIPDHPFFGSDLSLPSLLRIPTLRQLTIRETHLGHEGWESVPVACRLEVLDLGSCYHEDEAFNTRCTERIMSAVGPTVDEFSLTTSVTSKAFAKPSLTPLPKLRTLHITPYFPVDSVVETVANLAGSPVERISVQCFEEDVVDVCTALEEFLVLRVERGPEFYDKLQRIDVAIALSDADTSKEEMEERVLAAKRLQDVCRHLQLASAVARFDKMVAELGIEPTQEHFNETKRTQIKSRSMTI